MKIQFHKRALHITIGSVNGRHWLTASIGARWLKPEFHDVRPFASALTVVNAGPAAVGYLRPKRRLRPHVVALAALFAVAVLLGLIGATGHGAV